MREDDEDRQVVGRALDRIAPPAEQVARGVDRMGDEPAGDQLQRVHVVLERRGDAEVATAAAQAPEELDVGFLGRRS